MTARDDDLRADLRALAEKWEGVVRECKANDPRWILDRSVTTLETALRELCAVLDAHEPATEPATRRMPTEQVLVEVKGERLRQEAKWGEQNHDPAVWLAILTEEVGELAEAILFDYSGGDERNHTHSDSMRAEAVQIAAVAVQFVEYLDRRPIPPGKSAEADQ